MTWRYWPFDPPHPLCCASIEWVIGDEERPACDGITIASSGADGEAPYPPEPQQGLPHALSITL